MLVYYFLFFPPQIDKTKKTHNKQEKKLSLTHYIQDHPLPVQLAIKPQFHFLPLRSPYSYTTRTSRATISLLSGAVTCGFHSLISTGKSA